MYPVMLNLENVPCLVVGGGGLALRRVEGLLPERARVSIIASDPIDAIRKLAERGAVRLKTRPYRTGDARGFSLVFAVTESTELNHQVIGDAEQEGIWSNVSEDSLLGSFHVPTRVQRGALQIGVATDGTAPFVSRRLRRTLESTIGPEWAEWADAAGRFRKEVAQLNLNVGQREDIYDKFYSATVDEERLAARIPSQEERKSWLESTARREPEEGIIRAVVTRDDEDELPPENRALVSLVGAGPGDAGLLTAHALRRLSTADAVVYDRLAATALPADLPPWVELHCVGKTAGKHPVAQEQINELLVRLGKDGKRVVRLKGGDPYVFGRGGEEAEVLADENIPFEVIPGITSGIGIAAYAGVPVTHRKESVRISMITAHECVKSGGEQVRWDLLAKDPHATILGYMGVTALPTVVERLIEAGMDPETPSMMVHRGTTAAQKTVKAPLRDLPTAVVQARLRPPGLFIIGPTVDFSDRLSWYMCRDLVGERLAVLAPAPGIRDALQLGGAEVIEVPLPVTPAARVVIGALPLSGCIFKDVDEVEAVEEERHGAGWSDETVAWCLGRTAAERARERGWKKVIEVPYDTSERALVAAITRYRVKGANSAQT